MAKKAKKKKSAASDAQPSQGRHPPVGPLLDPLMTGLVLAGLVAGPPLWTLYRSGDVDLLTALLRAVVVAVGCGFGATLINRLVVDYRIQQDRERRIQQMVEALEGVVHEGLPIQDAGPQATPPGGRPDPGTGGGAGPPKP
ncbi:MAG TPA: hypothetical protein VFP72_10505 [Kineosporiaceae bacterium]|nr:hypothetical protein [Kineosporiaceae bacterium]